MGQLGGKVMANIRRSGIGGLDDTCRKYMASTGVSSPQDYPVCYACVKRFDYFPRPHPSFIFKFTAASIPVDVTV